MAFNPFKGKKPVNWLHEDKKWWQCYKCKCKNPKSEKRCKDCHHRAKVKKDRECSPPPEPPRKDPLKRQNGKGIDKTLKKLNSIDPDNPEDPLGLSGIIRPNRHQAKPEVDDHSDETVWRCRVCHFDNDDDVIPHCKMCRSEKPTNCLKPYADKDLKDSYQKDRRKQKRLSRTMLKGNTQSVRKKDQRKREEVEALQTWRNIVDYCRANKTHYTDNSFPDSSDPAASRNIEWRRISEARIDDNTPGPWHIYRDDTSPADIAQGQLADCWLASAIALLANKDHASLLSKIIINKSYCDEGVYCVRLCKDGTWKILFIDDRIPCDPRTGRPIYVKPKGKQLWVALIEKAVAKLHGGYKTLENGPIVEAMAMLTGEPCEYVELQDREDKFLKVDREEIWKKLKESHTSGYLVGVTTPTKSSICEASGLTLCHAYPILTVQEDQNYRLIKLRSILEEHHITNGCLCDSSLKDKMELEYQSGEFWVTFEEFIKHFYTMAICKVRKNWNETRLKGVFPTGTDKPLKYFRFSVLKESMIHIGLFQKNMRGMPSRAKEHFVDMLIVVLKDKTEENPYSHEPLFDRVVGHSERLARGFVSCDTTLQPGMYTAACLSFRHLDSDSNRSSEDDDLNKDFTLVFHTSELLYVDEVDLTKFPGLKYAAADVLILLAKQLVTEKTENQNDRRKSPLAEGICTYSLVWWGEILVLENMSNRSVFYSRDYSTSEYIRPSRGSFCTNDIIHRHRCQIINVATVSEPSLGWRTAATKGFKLMEHDQRHNEPEITTGIEGLHSQRLVPDLAS